MSLNAKVLPFPLNHTDMNGNSCSQIILCDVPCVARRAHWRLLCFSIHHFKSLTILWEKARVGCFKRTASKHVYYLGWNRSPAQVGCMRQALEPGALGRPRGIGWRGRCEGGSGWGTHVNPWLFNKNKKKSLTIQEKRSLHLHSSGCSSSLFSCLQSAISYSLDAFLKG